ncbi:MAG: thiamine phosphate synthase [Muribaculaceae bacterium]|nr:thiamine phosphate synthase [Muribaculaceae bacterium]
MEGKPATPVKEFITVGFTLPDRHPSGVKHEAAAISEYLSSGAIDFFHIRKPACDIDYTRELIKSVDPELHPRLVLHSHYDLAKDFALKGVHSKAESAPLSQLHTSAGFHSLEELESADVKRFDYVFLSPVFDSISKQGYASPFNLDDDKLKESLSKFKNVVGLGGVSPEKFLNLCRANFAGAALLGYLWSDREPINEKIETIKKFKILCCNS